MGILTYNALFPGFCQLAIGLAQRQLLNLKTVLPPAANKELRASYSILLDVA